ncbi:MAG TPA: phospholipase D-like domain-containing protein [Elusimicrobiales bacterium]|nr:phospholipase D-like domain-containing protein [Elusimicrobiales bacterium]
MKKVFVAALLLLLVPGARAAELQIVESVPEETVYGSALTARPQAVWLEMINSAAKTLDLEQFYIADQAGEVLEPVLEAVKAAAGRGVKVRFIVDSVMMKESGQALPPLRRAGVDARVIDFKKKGAGGVQHSKFFVVDGREVFVGSQNFDWRSLKHIHEVGVRIKSERAAADFGRMFGDDWALADGGEAKKLFSKKAKKAVTAGRPEEAVLAGSTNTVKYSLAFGPEGFIPKGFDTEIGELLKMIKAAKKTLRGQVMTYALSEHGSKRWADLDEAFRIAAARGVKVELVFADWGMGGKADRDIKALSKTDNISIKISSLPLHSSGLIPFARVEHCKYLVADGETGFVTTSNWGPGYFLTSRGAAVIIKGAAGAAILEDIFSKTWTGPYAQPVDAEKDYQPVKRS